MAFPSPQVLVLAASTCRLCPCLKEGCALWALFVSGDSALGVQVTERQVREWEAARQEEEEEEEAKQAEELSSALLQQEAKTMAEEGYQPKVGTCQVLSHHGPVLSSYLLPVYLSRLVIGSVQGCHSLDLRWSESSALVPPASAFAKTKRLIVCLPLCCGAECNLEEPWP